jgi:hypothetical protein
MNVYAGKKINKIVDLIHRCKQTESEKEKYNRGDNLFNMPFVSSFQRKNLLQFLKFQFNVSE